MPISDEGDTLGIGESWEGSKYGRYQAISHNPDMAIRIYRANIGHIAGARKPPAPPHVQFNSTIKRTDHSFIASRCTL